jgi:protein tyrosine/serine phosphatase
MTPDWIDLDGTNNTRDLGGLPTADGQQTVRGRLLRSDNLQDLSPADVRRLVTDYRVRTVADLRAVIEVKATGPGPLTAEPEVTIVNLSLFPEHDDHIVPPSQRRSDVGRGFSGLYLGFLADRPDSVLTALRMVAHGEGATVVHCTAGKDRTGVVVALALAEAGVERPAIVADYAASADHYDALLRRLAPAIQDDELAMAAALKHLPRPVNMDRFLDALAEEFGGPEAWLTAHGWTQDDRAALRRKLLAALRLHDHPEHSLGAVSGGREGRRRVLDRVPVGDEHRGQLRPGRQHLGDRREVPPPVEHAVSLGWAQRDLLDRQREMGQVGLLVEGADVDDGALVTG